MRSSLLSLILLLAPASARADTWNRLEYFGGYVGPGLYGLDLFSYGLYHERYGVGAGTKLVDFRGDTWDIPRHGKPDASAHLTVVPIPLELRVVLASWEGAPFVEYVNAESSNGRVELHGWYCPWAFFGAMTDMETDILGERQRTQINDIARGEAWDWGIGYDAGQLWSFTVGRYDFRVHDDGNFRARQNGRWYAALRLYLGRTHGRTVGANPLRVFTDAAPYVCRFFGGCRTVER
ncbi:MAG: hypothetical protein KGJ84_16100 [Elusimicrobia bacterium]|nr:hypothetical protein [Elusimicrobiota bacterium]